MPAKGSEIVDVDVDLIHETDKAWLVSADGRNRVWVPKSVRQLEPKGKAHELTLPRSMAEEKGLV